MLKFTIFPEAIPKPYPLGTPALGLAQGLRSFNRPTQCLLDVDATVLVWSRDGHSKHAVPQPTQICRHQSLQTAYHPTWPSLTNDVFIRRTQSLEWIVYRPSGFNGPQSVQTQAKDISILNVRLLHSDSLATCWSLRCKRWTQSESEYESESEAARARRF